MYKEDDIKVFERSFSEVWMRRNYRLNDGDEDMRLFLKRKRRLVALRFRL